MTVEQAQGTRHADENNNAEKVPSVGALEEVWRRATRGEGRRGAGGSFPGFPKPQKSIVQKSSKTRYDKNTLRGSGRAEAFLKLIRTRRTGDRPCTL